MIVAFLKSMFLYALLLLPFYVASRIFYLRGKHYTYKRESIMLVFFIYCVCIFSQTIIPKFTLSNGIIAVSKGSNLVHQNFVPFKTIQNYIEMLDGANALIAFYNLAGNIILFIPFGLLIPLLWHKIRSFKGIGIVVVAIPVFIEGTQYFIGRSVDIDDVILNCFAIAVGYSIWKLYERRMKL